MPNCPTCGQPTPGAAANPFQQPGGMLSQTVGIQGGTAQDFAPGGRFNKAAPAGYAPATPVATPPQAMVQSKWGMGQPQQPGMGFANYGPSSVPNMQYGNPFAYQPGQQGFLGGPGGSLFRL